MGRVRCTCARSAAARKCKGAGHIKRGPRRRIRVCPRCKGLRRVQRRGSRTLHRLIFKIRGGRNAAARYREDSHGRS